MNRDHAADLLERLVCGDVGETRWRTRLMLERGHRPICDDIAYLALVEAQRPGPYPLLAPGTWQVEQAINVLGLRPWASTYRKALPPGETRRHEDWGFLDLCGDGGVFECDDREEAERGPWWMPEEYRPPGAWQVVRRWIDVSPWEPA